MKQSKNKFILDTDRVRVTYKYRDNYYIDIEVNTVKKEIEAWLYNSRYGIKEFIYGIEYDDLDVLNSFMQALEETIEDYIPLYKARYMD